MLDIFHAHSSMSPAQIRLWNGDVNVGAVGVSTYTGIVSDLEFDRVTLTGSLGISIVTFQELEWHVVPSPSASVLIAIALVAPRKRRRTAGE